VDVILLEGWMMGFEPVDEEEFVGGVEMKVVISITIIIFPYTQ
jgi:pantothenate kinase-related protein Tda10